MLGLMQDQPLLISSLIEFAARHHASAEIVSRRVEGDLPQTRSATRSAEVGLASGRAWVSFRVGFESAHGPAAARAQGEADNVPHEFSA